MTTMLPWVISWFVLLWCQKRTSRGRWSSPKRIFYTQCSVFLRFSVRWLLQFWSDTPWHWWWWCCTEGSINHSYPKVIPNSLTKVLTICMALALPPKLRRDVLLSAAMTSSAISIWKDFTHAANNKRSSKDLLLSNVYDDQFCDQECP